MNIVIKYSIVFSFKLSNYNNYKKILSLKNTMIATMVVMVNDSIKNKGKAKYFIYFGIITPKYSTEKKKTNPFKRKRSPRIYYSIKFKNMLQTQNIF